MVMSDRARAQESAVPSATWQGTRGVGTAEQGAESGATTSTGKLTNLMAIRDNQRQSEAIRSTQPTCSPPSIGTLREAIRDHQMHSEAIRSTQPTGSPPSIGTLREAASSESYWPRVPDEGGNQVVLSRNPYSIDTQSAWRES